MIAAALALLLALPAARAQTDSEDRLERVSQGLRSGAHELDAAIARVDEMTAGYAAGTIPADTDRAAAREDAAKRAAALWNLRDEFWSLDSGVRMARGAEAIGRVMRGGDAAAPTRAALDAQGAEDLGALTRALYERAQKCLAREELAHRSAVQQASTAKLRLLLSAGAGAAVGILVGLLLASLPKKAPALDAQRP